MHQGAHCPIVCCIHNIGDLSLVCVFLSLAIKHQSRAMKHGPALNVSLPVFQAIKNLSLRKLSLHEVTHYMATGSEYLSQDMI